MARVTNKFLADLTWEDISSMKTKEIRPLLQSARKNLENRLRTFESKPSVYSPAVENISDYYAQKGQGDKKKAVSRMKLSDMRSELNRISDFFSAKTSSIAGARKVATEQDIAIFGSTKTGKPSHRMTRSERTQFWALYDEYLNTYKSAAYIYGSNKIQQFLGDALLESRSRKGEFDFSIIEKLSPSNINIADLEVNPNFQASSSQFTRLSDRTDENVPNIYSGRWNPRKK